MKRIYTEAQVITMLHEVMGLTYVCRICGKVIFPQVILPHGKSKTIEIVRENGCIRGGLGNKTILTDVCRSCTDKQLSEEKV